MANRIRGSEITLRVAVDGELQDGTFFKVTEFTRTERGDLNEEGFLGEAQDDIDYQHHGWDFAFTLQVKDAKALNFLTEIVRRDAAGESHPDITLTVIYKFRGGGVQNIAEVYHDVFLRQPEGGFSGRKDYITQNFEGKCKEREQMSI